MSKVEGEYCGLQIAKGVSEIAARRRAASTQTSSGLCCRDIGAQVVSVGGSDNGGIAIRMTEGKPEDELVAIHTVKEIIQSRLLPFRPTCAGLPMPLGDSASDDYSAAEAGRLTNHILMLAFYNGIGNMEGIEHPHSR